MSFVLMVAGLLWGVLAVYFAEPDSLLHTVVIFLFVLAGLMASLSVLFKKHRAKSISVYLSLFLLLVIWWSEIEPSNNRVWQADVERLASAEIDGDLVTVRNIRNFDYQTETEYTPRYYDKTFDLNKLKSLDLIAVYWMGPAIAHTFLSFGFDGGDQLAVSIETRKEQAEDYSTIKGFFKQYELYYVVADERDVIGLRTNYRKNPPEDVYIYRTVGPVENVRRLFLQYMQRINALNKTPEFYNTLVDNCTTGIWMNSRINPGHVPLSWKIFASGYVPSYLYDVGKIDTSLPFAELEQKSLVNKRAHQSGMGENFSELIREGLPGMNVKGQK